MELRARERVRVRVREVDLSSRRRFSLSVYNCNNPQVTAAFLKIIHKIVKYDDDEEKDDEKNEHCGGNQVFIDDRNDNYSPEINEMHRQFRARSQREYDI